ncbi:hypothetical protein LCH29_31725 [Streptomyces sp. BRA346]
MKALTWHGTADVRIDTVPDPVSWTLVAAAHSSSAWRGNTGPGASIGRRSPA